MKPFNIELAKANYPVQTRDGRPVRIVCYDRQTKNNIYSIVAMIKSDEGNEEAQYFTQKGEAWEGEINDLDLVMASTKKEGWINIYPSDMHDNNTIGFTSDIYKTEELALKHRTSNVKATKKIEWEE